jgi:ribosome-associated protein
MTQVPPSADDVLQAVKSSLDHDKADDVVVIDLAGKTSIADYMIVASGTSKRHIAGMSDHILEKVKEIGATSVATEGTGYCDWVLIDSGDVVVHLFRPEIREFYALERLWGAPSLISDRFGERRAGIRLGVISKALP